MRIISRLDIKNDFVIKGINLEGLRKVGNPIKLAKKYYDNGIDEIVMIDCVASLYKRNNLFNIVEEVSKNIFIPLTLGGGIRSILDIKKALNSGADKVAINSFAIENPIFLREATNFFGSSTIVSYIEAKKLNENKWEPYKYYGRERTNIDLIDWIKKVQDLGCGEILLTSIDADGLNRGFDMNLLNKINNIVNVPIIISGGLSRADDFKIIKKNYKNVSVCIASALHYEKIKIQDLKNIK